MRTARIFGFGVWVALAVAVAVGPSTSAQAQDAPKNQEQADEEARVHFRLGVAYHDSGRFAKAAAEFEQAYELSKRPKLLYNLFLAHRDGGNIAAAADALEKYLTLEKEVPERDKLTARLEALKRILANNPPQAQPAPEEEEQPEEEVAEAEPEAPPEPAMERNPWHKYTPWVTMGVGAAMVGVGAGMGAVALGDYNDCKTPGSCSSGEISSGQTKARVADAMLFGGAAIAVTGLVLYFVLPKEREVRTLGGVACGPGSCGVSVSHRF